MSVIYHKDSADIHKAAYVGTSDPGAVGAGKWWLDTSTTPPTLKERNAGDTAWTVRYQAGTGAGDFSAGNHSHDAAYVNVTGDTMTGELVAPDVKAAGLTGATAASRYVGATASGAPTSGTFALGDFVVDQTGKVWVCTTAGTPGTWTAAGAGGMLNPMTTIDDLIVGGTSGAPARLGKGSDGQVLTVDPTTHHLVWATLPASGMANPMTTAGDLILAGSGGTPTRLAKGADNYVFTIDPTTHLPVWAAAATGFTDPMTTAGDLVYRNGSNVTARLAKGSDSQFFIIDPTTHLPVWHTLAAADVPTLNQDTTGKAAKADALNSATTVVNVAAATAPSAGQVLTATSSTAATWQTPASGGSSTMTLIAETALTASAASITFSSIPGSYRHLQLFGISRDDSANTGQFQYLRVNGDTGSNYEIHTRDWGGTVTQTSTATTAQAQMTLGATVGANGGTGRFGYAVAQIPYYAGSQVKHLLAHIGDHRTNAVGNFWQSMYSCVWASTAAITSLTIYPATGNFVAGTKWSLYGIS